MGDVPGFGGDGHTAFGHGASVGFVGNGIALGVYLGQGIIYGVIDLQFEDINVVLGLGLFVKLYTMPWRTS